MRKGRERQRVVLLLRPVLASWSRRRRVWKAVVAVNAMVMTVYLWHTTALLVVVAIFVAIGLPIHSAPTAAWWAQRPLWLLVPGTVLAGLVALFAHAERRLLTQQRTDRQLFAIRLSRQPATRYRPPRPR